MRVDFSVFVEEGEAGGVGDAVDVELAVEVVDLVLEDGGEKACGFQVAGGGWLAPLAVTKGATSAM